jgi:MoaA/NifB/PqqE/SkfB family radical SAM enzyme
MMGGVASKLCVQPLTHLYIRSSGRIQVCCAFSGDLAGEDGEPLSVYSTPLPQIWNSPAMIDVRRDMIDGKEIPGCEYCYRVERLGGRSKRIAENEEWQAKIGGDPRLALPALMRESIATQHRLAGPASYHLDIGNLCNLKCRMCNGASSSRIQRDPVHRRWADRWSEPLQPAARSRFSGPGHWFQQKEFVIGELLRNPGQIKNLYILGGEPFIIKEVGDVLERLVEAGAARDVTLCFNTNGTTAKPRWLPLTREFRQLNLWFSVDGYGKWYEYIRYPARWSTLIETIETLRALPNASCAVSIAAQAYNVLHLVELFRYLDSIAMPFGAASIGHPRYLRSVVLPPAARRRAAERLRSYAEESAVATHRDIARTLASELEQAGDVFDPDLMHEFMCFTNALDQSRGQNLLALDPELPQLLAHPGFAWNSATVSG